MIIYNRAWFEKLCANQHNTICTEIYSKESRVSPTTFEFIVDSVRRHLEKHHANFRLSICIQKRVLQGSELFHAVFEKASLSFSNCCCCCCYCCCECDDGGGIVEKVSQKYLK